MPNIIAENPYASVTAVVTMIMVVIAYLLDAIWGVKLPAEVIVAVTGILSFFLGRWTRINKQDAKVVEVTTDKQKEAIIENAERTL